MKKAIGFLQEDNGSFSSTRLAFLLWVLGVLAAWCYVSAVKRQLQEIPQTAVALIGVLMTGKVIQKFSEEKMTPVASSQTSQVTQTTITNPPVKEALP